MNGPADLAERLRPAIADQRVLAAIAAVPREMFVAPGDRADAYANVPLPIGSGQTVSQPLVVARMCELLALRPGHRLLDVGTGSGYHAAILAQLVDELDSIERLPELAALAAANLAAAGVANVRLHMGDGTRGLPDRAPFDAINVAAAARGRPPVALEEQLAPGGRLVLPVAGRRGQRLVLVSRTATGFDREVLEPVRFVALRPGALDR